LDADLEKAGEKSSFCNGGLHGNRFTFSGLSRDLTAMQIDHHFEPHHQEER
jgi:hypothetical protein